MMSKEEAVNYWVKSSKLDLETAEDLFKTKEYFEKSKGIYRWLKKQI